MKNNLNHKKRMSDILSAVHVLLSTMFFVFLTIQGVHAGEISGTISGYPLSFIHGENSDASGNLSLNETGKVQMAALPLSFTPNEGQTDSTVRFMVKGSGTSFSFTNTSMLFSMQPSSENTNETPVVISQTFIGANESAEISGEDHLPGSANFFLGDIPDNWRSNISTYRAVRYHELYPGIDLLYRGNGSVLKREFIVGPGAKPDLIRMKYEGTDTVIIDPSGNLNITSGPGSMIESQPVCFQEINGTRVDIKARYHLVGNDELTIIFDEYNQAFELVIDPDLRYSTYLGGNDSDSGYGIAVDAGGNAYVTGRTMSANFPKTTSALYAGNSCYDIFVTKLNSAGTLPLYSTFIGGSNTDEGHGIAVDKGSGNAFVTGWTKSSNFPVISAYQKIKGGTYDYDAFVTKLNPTGSPVYSTYLGGRDEDYGRGIAIDSDGNAFVTGKTWSSDFPTTSGAYKVTVETSGQVFVTKLNSVGSGRLYSTYLGGKNGGYNEGNAIAVDGDGNAYITGYTLYGDFPTTDGAFQRTKGNNRDTFVTKLNPTGSQPIYSTFLGGSSEDEGLGIAVDGDGNAYITGETLSTDFPIIPGAYQTKKAGDSDAFVTKLNADGSRPLYSTYLGGTQTDKGFSIAINSGNAYVTGLAGNNFPITTGAYQTTHGPFSNTFITKLNTAGSYPLYSTYLGGDSDNIGYGIAVDAGGNAYVTGGTSVGTFPTTTGAFQTTRGGSSDAYIIKFSFSNSAPTIKSISPASGANTGSVSVTITGTNFASGMNTVKLTKSGQTAITATNVKRVSATKITCELPITGKAVGTWNVVLTTGGQKVTKSNGFTITTSTAPTITSISPNYGYRDGDTPVVISGTNFKAGEVGIFLTQGDLTQIVIWGPTDSQTSTQLSCWFPTRMMTAGYWNVEVTNGDGTYVIKPNAFSVLPSGKKDNIGVFRGNIWYLDYTSNGAWGTGDKQYTFGLAGDKPVVMSTGYWNDKSIIGVFRGNKWYFDYSGNGRWGTGDKQYTFGLTGDKPVTGDWNFDGKCEIGVFRGNKWYLDYSGNGAWGTGDKQYTFGLTGDKPVVGDWNGDLKSDIGVFRGNKWYLDYSGNGVWGTGDKTYSFGLAGDKPIVGDWNSDGKTEIGVMRGNKWYLDYSGNGAWGTGDKQYTFGLTGDIPITGAWSSSSGTASIQSVELTNVSSPEKIMKVPVVKKPVATVPKVEIPVQSNSAICPMTPGVVPSNKNPIASGGPKISGNPLL